MRASDILGGLAKAPPQEGREDSHGRHPCFSLRLVLETGDVWSVMYGTWVGSPYFNPSHGIQFVFEAFQPDAWGVWKEGNWLVTIEGHDLADLFNHLCGAKLEFIRVGQNVTGINVTPLKK